MMRILYLGFSAISVVGLWSDATPVAINVRSASAESLNVWIDSVRRAHNIPAMGVIVFRRDTILARGIAGVRRSNASTPVEERDRFQLGSNTKAFTAALLATLESQCLQTLAPNERPRQRMTQ